MTELVLDDAMVRAVTTNMAVRRKQESGLYPMEAVPCYCGASSPQMVADVDRYFMPCQTNLCPVCGLLYVSPRMTAASYRSFYELEYRAIYVTEDDQNALVGLEIGQTLLSLCEFYDVLPTSVIDVGCGKGELLRAFVQRGIPSIGIDEDPTAVAEGLVVGLPLECGTPEDLIARGETADLVILHHVLEHCLDLSAMLQQARQLLTPNGVLFVAVPGVQATPIKRMFQMAHVYHFTAETLNYVMECEGWRALMLGETIHSFWKPVDIRRDKQDIGAKTVKEVVNALGANPTVVPELKTYNKFPVKLQRENVRAVLASGIQDFSVIRGREIGHEAVIIGGGPSVDGQVERIETLIAKGCKVVAIERMAEWCKAFNILPHYLAVLDASEDVPLSLQHVHPHTICITATQCGQAVVDALPNHERVFCYSSPSACVNLPALFEQAVHPKQTILNAGGSVTLSAMTIAMALGMRSLHIFGFDCHVTERAYANGITGVGVAQPQLIEIEVDGKPFTTTGPYLSFAQQFFPLMETGRLMGFLKSVDLYGDSLVTAMGDAWLKESNLWPTT